MEYLVHLPGIVQPASWLAAKVFVGAVDECPAPIVLDTLFGAGPDRLRAVPLSENSFARRDCDPWDDLEPLEKARILCWGFVRFNW